MTILIDGNNLLMRELYSLDKPGKDNTHPVRSLYNDLSTNSDLTIIVWDGYNSNQRRKEIFPEYKGNRKERGEDIYALIKLFQELMQHTNVMQITVPTYEADDVIYTLAKFFADSGDDVTINTNDADYLQMADMPHVSLPQVRAWHWDADLLVTYKALVGDPADNIPGIPGFGEGAWGHVRTYHETLREALRDNNWELWKTIPFPKRNQKACAERGNFDNAVMFFKVVTMIDVPLDDITKGSLTGKVDVNLAYSLMEKYMI